LILRLISYNIQRGICFDAIFSHFKFIKEFQEADILVIQEVCVPKQSENALLRLLHGFSDRRAWSYRKVMTYPDKEYGNGFIFKEDWIPVTEEIVPFPQVSRLKWYEKQKTEGGVPDTKSAFVQTFRRKDCFIRIANVHMDFVGGPLHRQTQLQCLLDFLSRDEAPSTVLDVICGDFNTVGYFRSRRARQNTQSVLDLALRQGYINCSESIDWTSDLFSNIDADDPSRFFLSVCKSLKFHFRQKTDHVLAKGVKSILQAKKVFLPSSQHLPGSDHIPLYVELKI
jgi:endonuclease/exonuclease/phosphatase family metal-dependent hydrolase